MESLFIPERLKKIREDRGLNKAEAARLLGLSKMGYLRYESADRTPSHQTIVFMAQKLGTSPDYLIGITEDPRPNEYVISKSDDPVLFELITDVIDKKNPARDRILAYYKKPAGQLGCRPSNSEQVFSSDYSEPVLQCE